MKVVKAGRWLVLIIFHGVAGWLIYSWWRPWAEWYWGRVPALGVDFYNSVSHVAMQKRHFSWWFSGFQDSWFGGYPLMHDFPQFHYYGMLQFANWLGTTRGVQAYVLLGLFLLLICSYGLFYVVSKNVGLAVLLTAWVMLSPSIYGSATWGGSLPYFCTQFILPLALMCGVKYLEFGSSRWFGLMVLTAGLGFLGHPLPVATFVFPAVIILLVFHPRENLEKQSWWWLRFKDLVIFGIGVFGVSFVLFYDFIWTLINGLLRRLNWSPGVGGTEIAKVGDGGGIETDIAEFYKNQIGLLISDTHQSFWYVAAGGLAVLIVVWILLWIAKKPRRDFGVWIPFGLMAGYVAGHVAANFLGHSFLPQGLYRAFWAFPIVLGGLAAAVWRPVLLWGQGHLGLKSRWEIGRWGLNLVVAVGLVGLAYMNFKQGYLEVRKRVFDKADTSSAFPEVLSMKLDKNDQEELRKQLVPSFINPDDKNRRLYTSDATVNIWWNSFYEMPMVRGYIDPPIGADRRGGFYLLDTAIGNDSLAKDLGFPEEIAKNYALYLMDWYGVHYYEGGHLSPAANAPPSSYLVNSEVFEAKEEVTTYGAIHRYMTASGKPEARWDLPQSLVYYKVKPEYTSPVIYGSKAPVVLVISDDPGYEQIWRGLAFENLNSQVVVPIQGGKWIDEYDEKDLKSFDAVILHNYDYHNKENAFGVVKTYVENGGHLLIDTGGDAKESQAVDLEEMLPVRSTMKAELEKKWNWEIGNGSVTEGIELEMLGPAIYNDRAWKVSFPDKESDLREGAEVLLKTNGKVVLAGLKYGEGKVIWSGLNYPYHLNQYPTQAGGKLFKNLMAQLVFLEKTEVVEVSADWQRPEKVNVQVEKEVRGVLFKEQFYDGWRVNGGSRIWRTGPTYPGFMYVLIDQIKNEKSKIKNDGGELEFRFNGIPIYWIATGVNVLAVLVVLELIIFNGKLVGHHAKKGVHKVKRHVGSWWEKEEEE